MSQGASIVLPTRGIPWRTTEMARLWLSLRAGERPWRSLALVPASAGCGPDTLLQIAVALARVGMEHVGEPIQVADGTRLTLGQVTPFIERVTEFTSTGGTVLVSVSALKDNITALPVVKAADCALLCVVMGDMSLKEAQITVEQIGAQHFLGSVMLRNGAPE